MEKITIYHNPRCSKSRKALETLCEQGKEVEVVEYLKTPLTKKTLKMLLQKLNKKALEVIRTNEPLFKEKFQGKNFTEDEWIQLIIENPILLQRPIVASEYKAEIMR
ncbi:MAG: arsenate reductase family protein [Bacteroidetes bacterium]|nr:arsenate reductase family protein [Bacteroidota bacterium]